MMMKNDFLSSLEECKLVSLDDIKWYKSWAGSLLRVFAQLM
jgi:hypothetical protein